MEKRYEIKYVPCRTPQKEDGTVMSWREKAAQELADAISYEVKRMEHYDDKAEEASDMEKGNHYRLRSDIHRYALDALEVLARSLGVYVIID